jgi:hypothetical membrane protein
MATTFAPTEDERRPARTDTSASIERQRRTGGALLASAAAMIFLGIITAEAMYPAAYDTAENTISDLGATLPPHSVILQPSATIFDLTMIASGLAIVAGAYFVHRVFSRKAVTIPLALLGLGALGVGVFAGNHLAPHQSFAMTAFISGGVVAVLATTILAAPLRQISFVLGVASLISFLLAMFFMDWGPVARLGEGGIERWIVYPQILWLATFGGALMGPPDAGGSRSDPDRSIS